eukprot:11070490-Alexandrium_andersonii.AAC.1
MKWSCRICRSMPELPNLKYQKLEKWFERPQPARKNPDTAQRERKPKSKHWGGHWDPQAAEEVGPDRWYGQSFAG